MANRYAWTGIDPQQVESIASGRAQETARSLLGTQLPAGAMRDAALAELSNARVNGVVGAVNVRDHGAIGDGVVDDTAAIQAAIDYAPALGKTVYFPVGVYRITAPLVVKSHTKLLGAGMGGTTHGVFSDRHSSVIKNDGTGVALHLVDLTTSTNKTSMQTTITDLTLYGSPTSGHGIHVQNPAMTVIDRCFIGNHGGIGVYAEGGAYASSWGQNVVIRDCWITHCYIGCIKIGGAYRPTLSLIQGCSVLAGAKYLVYIENAWATNLISNEFASLSWEGLLQGIQGHGVVIDVATMVNIEGNSFEAISGRAGFPVKMIKTGFNGDTQLDTASGLQGLRIVGNSFNPGVPDVDCVHARKVRGLTLEGNFFQDGSFAGNTRHIVLEDQEAPWPVHDLYKNAFIGQLLSTPVTVLNDYTARLLGIPTYGPSIPININGTTSGPVHHFKITANDGAAFTIQNPVGFGFGDEIEITIVNNFGPVLGAITWGTAYKLAPWTSPTTSTSRSIRFRYDPYSAASPTGPAWFEVSRTPADVPNA